MALQSEVSPPMVGDPNKDTKIEGDTKSDDNESSQSTDEDVDLEEGEILDSGAEEEEEKDFTNSSLKEALDKSCLQNIEQLVNHRNNTKPLDSPNRSKVATPRKLNKMAANYMDHDQLENTSDQEDGWVPDSTKYKSKYEDKPVDYRMELAAYRGTPPSSPERKRRDDKSRKKKSSSKKSKKTRKTIKRKDIRGLRVAKYVKEAAKHRICKFFKEGKCSKGVDCLYSHSAPPPPFKKKELCKFYLNGHCNKGKDCLYMHNEFPCKFYHTGTDCYAKNDCRFSHTPLNDEMRRVLADYLKMSHGDDVRLNRSDDRDKERGFGDRDERRDRKRCTSRSPEPKAPPPKRTCLLGSPPRHIREAEETRRWQEEMKLQQQNHPGFEIHLSPSHEEGSPTHFAKPNFYQETLLNTPSPKRKQPNSETPNFLGNSSNNYEQETSSKFYIYDDDDEVIEIEVPPVKREPSDEFHWNNVRDVTRPEEGHMKQFNENSQQELDFTNDVKFDETTQFSEMESSTDCPPNVSPDHPSQNALSVTKESEETTNIEKIKIKEEKLSDDETMNSSQETSAPSIVIPTHLPRKQQELFKRVLKHQKKTDVKAPSSPSNTEVNEPQVKKEESDNEEKIESKSDFKWYSSEDDDDDDSDQPLTAVLKKIQEDPPSKPVVQETKPTSKMNLLEMFRQIQQSALQKNKGLSNEPQQQKQPQDSFWENILGGNAPSKPLTSVNPNPVISEPKRRTLLPDPVPLSTTIAEPLTPKEPVIKDPRLKNRDPRKLANASVSTPKLAINSDINNSSIQVQNIIAPKPTANVMIEPCKEGIPYRLRGILAKPPNYTPYLSVSQSNPNLLKDPRLRKHLSPNQSNDTVLIGNGKDTDVVKTTPQPKDAPPIPELLLNYKPAASINIFESSKSAEKAKEVKPPAPVVYDPRVLRRDSRSNSGSDTPPHLTIVDASASPPQEEIKSAPVLENEVESIEEKKWLPPVLEKTWTSGIEKDWTSLVIKSESDTDSNCEPPVIEADSRSSPKKSPPSQSTKEEFITVIKKEPSPVKHGNLPVVPPLIIKKVKPTPPASHLPRAIADPRMAKLHDRRRPLVSSDTNSKSIIERKKQPVQSNTSKMNSKLIINESDSSNSTESQKSAVDNTSKKASKDEKLKSAKSIPKKRRLSDKSDEKKKPVHRNRKSSMDYASPLNSCDATNDGKSLDYNSYNQRPKRTVTSQNEQSIPNNSPSTIAELSDPPIPDFILSDNSNLECDNSSDVNLKDRFKTIDPTASPFC
ncbi:transposon Tf2-6 polyprotein [Nephila pilipes]|uniref:Transposon Tf2-6 polyprotein n=1 Tax=Nephila pilipes TaxID=299642 RepID=A0A8X6TSY0_NEPPI|nr:transposon Tf2-6 polyprotein [Nephila pilipes]